MTPTSLLTRVLAATKGSRELDGDIARALDPDAWKQACRRASQPSGAPIEVVFRDAPFYVPAYTTDLSAAVALVKRVRPGWTIELKMFPGGNGICHLLRYVDHEYEGFVALGPKGELPHTPALALLAALLMSLEDEDAR